MFGIARRRGNQRTSSTDRRTRKARPAREPGSVGIPIRNVRPRVPDDAPTYFAYDHSPFITSLFAVFSGIFPPGERFFMESVRRFRDDVDDEELRAAITGFLGQETMHGREHERLNAFFAERGFDVELAERQVRLGLALLERLPPTQQLACTTFMEHFTAHLAKTWLTDETLRRTSDPRMLALWQWHALEELEHRSVAFDVHERVGGTFEERVLAGPLVVAAILPGILYSLARLVAARDEAGDLRSHRRALVMLFGKRGFLTRTLRGMPSYFDRGFHPRSMRTERLEAEWRERLFGPAGALTPDLRVRAV